MRKFKFPSEEEKRIEQTENEVANLLFENMTDKMKISQLEMDLGNALFEIMMLKMGSGV